MKSAKPSKSDLLKELESIRESLLSDGAEMEASLASNSEASNSEESPATKDTAPAASNSTGDTNTAHAKTEKPHDEKPHSLMKKSYLEIDESDYDYELKIPAHATESASTEVESTEEENVPVENVSAESAEEETAAEAATDEQIEISLPDADQEEAEQPHAQDEPLEAELEDDIAELAQMLSHEEEGSSHDQMSKAITLENEVVSEDDVSAALAESAPETEDDHESETLVTLDEPIPASETPTMEVPAINDLVLAQNTQPARGSPKVLSPKVLPGQQSLFDDNIVPESQVPAERIEKAPPLKAAAVKPLVENPFLPAHIKAKLERERTLYEQEINAAVQTNSARYYPAKVPAPAPAPEEPVAAKTEYHPASKHTPTHAGLDAEHEALIDEVVSEYLPQIEAKLRKRLRECLAEASEE